MIGVLSIGFLALGLTAANQPAQANLSVEFGFIPPCEGEFSIRNTGSVPYVMRNGGLPWKARDLSRWVAVEDVTLPQKVIEPGTQLWDYSGSGNISIAPGDSIKGSIQLVEIFHGLRHPRKKNVVVFVRWECPDAFCPGKFTFSGSLIVGTERNCRGTLKWYEDLPKAPS